MDKLIDNSFALFFLLLIWIGIGVLIVGALLLVALLVAGICEQFSSGDNRNG